MNKIYKTLELDKIVKMLKKHIILSDNLEILEDIELMNDIDDIKKHLDQVDEASIIIQRMSRFPLYFNVSIKYLLDKVNKYGILDPQELLNVMRFLDTSRDIKLFSNELNNQEIYAPNFSEISEDLIYHKDLNKNIKSIIYDNGLIKDDASRELLEIRRQIKRTESTIDRTLQDLLKKHASKLSQAVISIRNERFVLPVKNDYKNQIEGIIHDYSASGETVYLEPSVIVRLNNDLNKLKEEEEKEINRILQKISIEINNYYEELLDNYCLILHLDLIFAKAYLALEMDAKKPNINDKGIVDLINCRHPLLNVETVVSNNISLGKNYQGIIITGPNTGGKTVLLKTLGLLSLMTKFGLLIPCDEESNMMIFDNVFADIGDEQSIDQNLSTFSSHLKNIIDITNNVTPNSLVLLDELGSGTDPAEGASLAIAILEYLLSKNCLVMVTSHFNDLKVYGYNSDKLINASVDFDINTLEPTYKLLIGVPGQSHALNISKNLGLNEDIIELAKNYGYQKDDNLNQVLDKLVKQSYELDQKIKQSDEKLKEYKKLQKDLDNEINVTITLREKILSEAETKANQLIKESLKEAEDLINELEELKTTTVKPHQIAEAKYRLKKAKDIDLLIDDNDEEKDFEINERVFLPKYQNYGIIRKMNRNDRFDIQMGNATIVAKKEDLKKTSKQKEKPKKPVVKTSTKQNFSSKQVGMKLDLRGYRYEDAKIELEKYFDDLIFTGLKECIIIHGYGTGTIRNLVQDFLKKNKFVESYRYGGSSEGGFGATVVTLK